MKKYGATHAAHTGREQGTTESLVCSLHEFDDYTNSYREVEKELKEWMGDF